MEVDETKIKVEVEEEVPENDEYQTFIIDEIYDPPALKQEELIIDDVHDDSGNVYGCTLYENTFFEPFVEEAKSDISEELRIQRAKNAQRMREYRQRKRAIQTAEKADLNTTDASWTDLLLPEMPSESTESFHELESEVLLTKQEIRRIQNREYVKRHRERKKALQPSVQQKISPLKELVSKGLLSQDELKRIQNREYVKRHRERKKALVKEIPHETESNTEWTEDYLKSQFQNFLKVISPPSSTSTKKEFSDNQINQTVEDLEKKKQIKKAQNAEHVRACRERQRLRNLEAARKLAEQNPVPEDDPEVRIRMQKARNAERTRAFRERQRHRFVEAGRKLAEQNPIPEDDPEVRKQMQKARIAENMKRYKERQKSRIAENMVRYTEHQRQSQVGINLLEPEVVISSVPCTSTQEKQWPELPLEPEVSLVEQLTPEVSLMEHPPFFMEVFMPTQPQIIKPTKKEGIFIMAEEDNYQKMLSEEEFQRLLHRRQKNAERVRAHRARKKALQKSKNTLPVQEPSIVIKPEVPESKTNLLREIPQTSHESAPWTILPQESTEPFFSFLEHLTPEVSLVEHPPFSTEIPVPSQLQNEKTPKNTECTRLLRERRKPCEAEMLNAQSETEDNKPKIYPEFKKREKSLLHQRQKNAARVRAHRARKKALAESTNPTALSIAIKSEVPEISEDIPRTITQRSTKPKVKRIKPPQKIISREFDEFEKKVIQRMKNAQRVKAFRERKKQKALQNHPKTLSLSEQIEHNQDETKIRRIVISSEKDSPNKLKFRFLKDS